MQGLHLTADLHDCACDLSKLTDVAPLEAFGSEAVRGNGLKVVGLLVHAFPATFKGQGGVTATWLLAESHVCVHTWPEQRAVTLDVYVCNFGADHGDAARAVADAFIAFFEPRHVERHDLRRGDLR